MDDRIEDWANTMAGSSSPSGIQHIEEFGNDLSQASQKLRAHFLVVGRTGLPVGSLAGLSRSGEIEHEGVFDTGEEFAFHGIGCRVLLGDGTEIDFDWDAEGRQIFDAWRLTIYLKSRGLEASTRVVDRLLATAQHEGLISATGRSFYYFTEAVDSSPLHAR